MLHSPLLGGCLLCTSVVNHNDVKEAIRCARRGRYTSIYVYCQYYIGQSLLVLYEYLSIGNSRANTCRRSRLLGGMYLLDPKPAWVVLPVKVESSQANEGLPESFSIGNGCSESASLTSAHAVLAVGPVCTSRDD